MIIKMSVTGEEFFASFPYNPALVTKLKTVFSNPTWKPREKRWAFPVNGRNFTRVRMESGQEPFAHLTRPIVPTKTDTRALGNVSDYDFKPHQQEIYDFITQKRNCIIAGQMRTGKTFPTLMAMNSFKGDKAWYIAPKSAIRGVRREFEKWLGIKFDKQGKVLPRKYGGKQLPYELTLINYEKWARILNAETIKELVPPIVIFDEIHRLKGDKTNVGKLSREVWLAQAKKYGTDGFMLVGLSGTPSPKDPSDWHNILETVVPGFTPYGTKGAMERDLAYCTLEENEVGQKYWKVNDWREDEVNKFADTLVGTISLPIFKKDVLDLPDKVHEYIELKPDRETLDAIDYMVSTTKTKIELINKSRQISDGFLYDNVPDEVAGKNVRTTDYLPTPKNQQLKEDLAELDSLGIDRVVVLGAYKASVDVIADILITEGWETIRIDGRGYLPLNSVEDSDFFLEEFDNSTRSHPPKKRKLAIVGHPKSVATGLELSATPVMIYWSHTNDGEAEFQSVERAHSMNMDMERGLTIKHYCHLPVDKMIIENLVAKTGLQEITMGSLLDKLKEKEYE